MQAATPQKQDQTPSQSQKRAGLFFQPKLTINQPNDVYEQEADAVADKVMRMQEPSSPLAGNKPFFSPPTVNINKVNTAKEEPLKKENKEEETEEPLPEIQAKLSVDGMPPPPDENKPNLTGLLQRKCAHCEEEEKQLQRKETNSGETVTDASTESYISSLNGKGRSLTEPERKFFEPRMGYDFSNVQLHTNAEASQSAKSINALAYTHGNNIVFGSGRYQPDTDEGKRLMAHELTHVVQQKKENAVLLNIIQRTDISPLVPNYSQMGDTCGAASIVAALTIWHNEHRNEGGSNSIIATTCNIILSYVIHSRSVILGRIRAMPRITDPAEDFLRTIEGELTSIRDRALSGSREINETDFQHLGLYLALIFNSDGFGGLSSFEITDLLNGLHMLNSERRYSTLDDILNSAEIAGLGNDAAAQINWISGTTASFTGHAFIIGRLIDGNWYLYDQGSNPPFRLQEATYLELRAAFTQAMQQGRSSILRSYPAGATNLRPWTGVRLLNRPDALQQGYQYLIIPGEFLAEIDAGVSTTGDRLECMGFVGAEYDLRRAQTMFTSYKATHGSYNYSGVITEMPRGVFNVYTANTVSSSNINVRVIDASDSSGGKLAGNIYYHAYLLLCSDTACSRSFFTVY